MMSNIKNIIFDLGNVLLDIDYNKTTKAFEDLGFANFKNDFYSPLKMNALFEDLETGKVTEETFYESIKAVSPHPVSNEQLQTAWDALFLDFRIESLAFLEQIASKYSLYLLSNTNSIHYTAFKKIFTKDTGKPSLDDYFIKAYYSHLIGFRKPDTGSYAFVLEDAGIKAGETLFIDDLVINVEGARSVGIKSHLLLPNERIENLKFI